MNQMSLGRILWIRWPIVLIATLGSLLGGVVMVTTTPKGYDATTRVQLDIIKPDPITGYRVSSKNAVSYITSQIRTIQDFQVAGRAAENLGWFDDSDLQTAYAQLPPGTSQDFQHWVAKRIIGGTLVRPVEDSNLLEIKYRSTSPDVSRIVAEAIRKAYLEDMASTQASIAQANLPRFQQLASQSQAKLSDLENQKAALEKASGIVLQDNNVDMDSARLSSMAVQSTPTVVTGVVDKRTSQLKSEAAQLDSLLADATKTLGPNNPRLLALRQRRALVESQLGSAKPAGADAAETTAANGRSQAALVAAQTAKVISQGGKRTELRLIQDAINTEKLRYRDAAQGAVRSQQMLAGGGGNVSPVGLTEASTTPAYPQVPLVIGGSGGLGLILGILLALMAEFSARRVRGDGDLRLIPSETGVMIIPTMKQAKANGPGRRLDEIRTAA
jgi:uncharacterized protein involved in exopolysaccharide biosynthesis